MKLTCLFSLAILLWIGINSCTVKDSNTIIIADFDSGSYEDWEISGDAFGSVPADGENTHHMIGFLGSGYTCSAHNDVNSITGTLTSPYLK